MTLILSEIQISMRREIFFGLNRTEVSLGKKLKIKFLVEIEKVLKRKEKLLKKQPGEALLLDSFMNMDELVAGRSLHDRKPVTYTFAANGSELNAAPDIDNAEKQPPPVDDVSPNTQLTPSGVERPTSSIDNTSTPASHRNVNFFGLLIFITIMLTSHISRVLYCTYFMFLDLHKLGFKEGSKWAMLCGGRRGLYI